MAQHVIEALKHLFICWGCSGIGKYIGLRLYPELEAALGAYEKAQDKPPSRPEAIRQILTDYLARRGYLKKG